MGKMENNYSKHHLLPKSRSDNSSEYNLHLIKDNTHKAIHVLFSNDIFPDQLKKLIGLNYSALKTEVIQELFEVINKRGSDPHDRYREECFTNNG